MNKLNKVTYDIVSIKNLEKVYHYLSKSSQDLSVGFYKLILNVV